MNEPPILCKGFHLFARSITDPSLTIRLPYEPDSSVLLLAVAAGAVGLGSAILTLETNGLVDEEVTHARVGGRGDGKGNDDTCRNVRDRPCHRRWIAGADRGGSTREESCEGASGVARRYELFQWTRRQHDLGPDVFEGSSRRRAMVGVCRRRSMAHVPACSSFCTDTKHRQLVTDAIDGISAGNGAATTDRTNIPARGSSGAPLGGTPAGQLAWETCWPRCGVESGVVVEKSPAQGRFDRGERALEGEGLHLQFERYGVAHQWVGAGARLSHEWSHAGQLQPLTSAHGPGEQAQNLPQAVTLCSSSPCHRLAGSNWTESTDSFGDYLTSELSHHPTPPHHDPSRAIEPPPSLKVALETPNRPTCPTTSALPSPSSSSLVWRPCSSSHAKFPRPGKLTWPDVDGIPVSGRLLTVSTAGMPKIPH